MVYSPAAGRAVALAGARAGGGAHAPAPVAQADHAAECHDDRADPDPGHQRLPVDPHGPVARGVGITQRDIEVGQEIGADRGLAGGLLLQREEPPFGVHHGDQLAAAGDADGGVVGRRSSGRGDDRHAPASVRSRRSRCVPPGLRISIASCAKAEAAKPATDTARPRCAKVMP